MAAELARFTTRMLKRRGTWAVLRRKDTAGAVAAEVRLKARIFGGLPDSSPDIMPQLERFAIISHTEIEAQGFPGNPQASDFLEFPEGGREYGVAGVETLYDGAAPARHNLRISG
jgi:hypothetical protein